MSGTDLWRVEPRDTLVLGDGRPVTAGAPMRSLSLPWPSTMAGLLRTQIGGFDENGHFGLSREAALAIEVAGPWLVREHGGKTELLVEAPRDVVWFAHGPAAEVERQRIRLLPQPTPRDAVTDLPDELELVRLDPTVQKPEGKPDRQAPRYWRWSAFESWLSAPVSDRLDPRPVGVPELVHEVRRHVSLDAKTGTASEGMLFAVDQVRYVARDGAAFSLLARCANPKLAEGVVTLGGERRPSFLRRCAGFSLPQAPRAVLEGSSGRLRLVLLTPGLFEAGWRPRLESFGARIVAAVVPRAQAVSGWDYERRGPKPSRRVVPAGSVYWVELDEGVDRAEWIRRYWMQSIADDEQDRRDGFGIVAIGVA